MAHRLTRQAPLIEILIDDPRPLHEWAESLLPLSRLIYARDDQLAREFERILKSLASSAANLDCIGTDDPTAPPLGSPARDVLTYFFRRHPELRADFNRRISRIAQLLGRHAVLSCAGRLRG